MTQLIAHKDKMQDILMVFLSRLQSDFQKISLP